MSLISLISCLVSQGQPAITFDNQSIRPLSGYLNKTPVFNSNSPEVIKTEGILLSTFPNQPENTDSNSFNLNYPFSGRFEIFSHHISNEIKDNSLHTLYEGILLGNETDKQITVKISQAASYLSQPDAPFIALPDLAENTNGSVYAGPGDRVAYELISGQSQSGWPGEIILPPKTSKMLMNLPIPVMQLTPPLNGRSTLIRLDSSGPVYVADLALYAKTQSAESDTNKATERAPKLEEWQQLLDSGKRAGPDEPKANCNKTNISYGRVAGVQIGSLWQTNLSDKSGNLIIAQKGAAIDFIISSLIDATFGTAVDDSAPLITHYKNTACEAHGNYGVEYKLTLPLYNPTKQTQTVAVSLQTPFKTDRANPYLRFADPKLTNTSSAQVFFRGNIKLEYEDDKGKQILKYVHIVQRKGQMGEPFITLNLLGKSKRTLKIDFIYPADCTPPQVLTVATL